MLLKDNKQHLAAFASILDAATVVTAYNLQRDNDTFYIKTLYGGALEHGNLLRIMAVLWTEHKGSIYVPLRGKWYARLKPAIDGKHAAYELILTSNDKRADTCVYVEHYNATGGYYYTSQYDLSDAGQKAMQSTLFISLRSIVSAFNRAAYLR